jgi:hypothetical protein
MQVGRIRESVYINGSHVKRNTCTSIGRLEDLLDSMAEEPGLRLAHQCRELFRLLFPGRSLSYRQTGVLRGIGAASAAATRG